MVKKSRTAAPGLANAGLGPVLRRAWNAGLEGLWRSSFGPPDLGPVAFAALERRRSPNDALVCPKDVCPNARPDVEPPLFPFPAARLRALVSEAALSEPDTVLVQSGAEQDRYLVRTRLMRFPDTVVAQVIAREGERSTLALYSRSQIGRSDFGVNRRRLERWVERIGRLAAQRDGRSSP